MGGLIYCRILALLEEHKAGNGGVPEVSSTVTVSILEFLEALRMPLKNPKISNPREDARSVNSVSEIQKSGIPRDEHVERASISPASIRS